MTVDIDIANFLCKFTKLLFGVVDVSVPHPRIYLKIARGIMIDIANNQ